MNNLERGEYSKSAEISDFGYFRIPVNLYGLRTFRDLEGYSGTPGVWPLVMELTQSSSDDVPLEVELPSRPRGDVRLDEIELSLAELAGVSAFVKSEEKRESVVFGYTYLGRFARRWFNVIELESAPKSNRDNWIVKARGEGLLEKIDKEPSLIFLRGKDLRQRFGITLGDLGEFYFGGLGVAITNEGLMVRKDGEVKRTDVHSFIGFWKAFSLYSLRSHRSVFSLNLVDSPLAPFDDRSGKISTKSFLGVDAITSYK